MGGGNTMEDPEKQTYVCDSEAEAYRKKIVKMVKEIENKNYLFKIYHYVLAKHRRDGSGRD